MSKRISLKGRGADIFFGDDMVPISLPSSLSQLAAGEETPTSSPEPRMSPREADAGGTRIDPPQTSAPTDARPGVRSDSPTDRSPDGRRAITRYAFEFYQDQIETLRHAALQEKLRGGKGSMSEMVREALDRYLGQAKQPEA